MKRQLLGVIAATVAAPYIVVFAWSFLGILLGDEVGLREPLDLIKTIPIGTFAFLVFGIPVLALACLCAVLVNAFNRPSKWAATFSGGLLGLCFMAALFIGSTEYHLEVVNLLISGIVSGALSGWIYWRIALRNRPPAGPTEQQEAV